MTDKEKKQVEVYRGQGLGYTEISKKMDLSIGTIKAYCRRHGFGGKVAYGETKVELVLTCECCGKPVKQNPGRKKKRFCSDKCRNVWWNSHMNLVKRKANYECICLKCGKKFISYGNRDRKYCSHDCYVDDRFGGEVR